MENKEKQYIKVQLGSVLQLLADSLYSRPDTCIRELLANATDSLHTRQHAVTGEGAPLPAEYAIWIWYDSAAGVLSIRDSGIGMTRQEIEQYLTYIGVSGTKMLREKVTERDLVKKLIGQFGIGLLSCFKIARKIEIHSLSARQPGAVGHRWICLPDGSYEVQELAVAEAGTTVKLYVEPRHQSVVSGEALNKSVQLYGDFLPFPIYDNLRNKLNVQTPPWEDDNASDKDYSMYVSRRFEWDPPLFVIPVRYSQPGSTTQLELDIRGVVFIPSEHQFINRTGAVDLYVKHMLVRQDCPSILADSFVFLAGVLECPQLTMIMSREDVMRNDAFIKFQRELNKLIATRLGSLGERPNTLRGVLAAHGPQLKNAVLQNDDLFDALVPSLPFRSGTTGAPVVLQEYMKGAVKREGEADRRRIYYFTSSVAGIARFQINQVLAVRGIEVLEAVEDVPGKSLDHMILDRYAQRNGLELSDAEERSDLFPPVKGWETVEALFTSVVPSLGSGRANVRTTEFEPVSLPLLIFTPKQGGVRQDVKKLTDRLGELGNASGLASILRLAEQKLNEEEGATLLLINSRNEEMKLLREKVRYKIATDAAIEIYHLAMEYSGYVWDQRNLNAVRACRQRFLNVCLKGAEELERYAED